MGCLPYFKFWVQDWIAGVLSLSLAERGAYISLLAWSWEHGPLPLEEPARARILSIGVGELRKIWPALAPYWRETAKGFVNKRLELERKSAKGRSAAAKRSADERWARANGVAR